jgi:hypothetical protein
MLARRQPGEYPGQDDIMEYGPNYPSGQYSPPPIPGINGWDGDPATLPPKEPGTGQIPGGNNAGNSTTPRESFPSEPARRAPGDGAQATPPRPMSPTPMAGASAPAVAPPMQGGAPLSSLASPARRGLFGGTGGLTGGGLGVPGDGAGPGNDPISALIQQLLQNRG